MTSISRNLVRSTLIGALALITGQLLVLFFVERGELMQQNDAGLEEHAECLAPLFRLRGNEIEVGSEGQLDPELLEHAGVTFFQVWRDDGEVVARSVSLEDRDLPIRAGEVGDSIFWNLQLPDGTKGRAVGQLVVAHQVNRASEYPDSEYLTMVVARQTDSIRDTLLRFILTDALVAFASAAIFAIYLMWMVRSLLQPVTAFGQYLESMDANSLAEPQPVLGLPRELTPIAVSFERMRTRLAESFERERRTASSMAHELRTPVSELLTMSEVALLHSDEPELALGYLSEVREVALHMRGLITTMLSLARLQLAPEDLRPRMMNLGEVFADLWLAFAEKATRKNLQVSKSVDESVVVWADDHAIKSILSNLLSNAVEYTPDGGSLSIQISDDDGFGTLVVMNDCPGFQMDDLDRLTEFFWRKGNEASSEDGHVGLGLAVSKELATVSGMKLELRLDDSRFSASLRVETER